MREKQAKNGPFMTVAACLWLGLFPLLQGLTYSRITLDKWRIMVGLCGVTLALFLIGLIFQTADGKRLRAGSGPAAAGAGTAGAAADQALRLPLILGSLLLLWTALSCLLSPYGADVWWIGASARREGLSTQLCYLGLFFLYLFSRVRLRPLLFAACGGVTLFAAVVALQRLGYNPLGLYPAGRSFASNPEFQGTIGNIDMDTGYLCLLAGLFLAGGLREAREFRGSGRAGRASLVCCVLGLILCGALILSMGVQFGQIALAALLLFTLLRLIPSRRRLAVLALILALALLAVWFWPGSAGGVWELHEILHGRGRLSFGSNRAAVWLYSLRLAGERPLSGGGSDTFVLRFNDYLETNGLTIPTEQDGVALPDYFDNPHNEYLSQLLNHGLPAMLLLILLMGGSIFRRRDGYFPLLTPCSSAVLCYAVQAFFSFPVCLVSPMFWVLLGISFSQGDHDRKSIC